MPIYTPPIASSPLSAYATRFGSGKSTPPQVLDYEKKPLVGRNTRMTLAGLLTLVSVGGIGGITYPLWKQFLPQDRAICTQGLEPAAIQEKIDKLEEDKLLDSEKALHQELSEQLKLITKCGNNLPVEAPELVQLVNDNQVVKVVQKKDSEPWEIILKDSNSRWAYWTEFSDAARTSVTDTLKKHPEVEMAAPFKQGVLASILGLVGIVIGGAITGAIRVKGSASGGGGGGIEKTIAQSLFNPRLRPPVEKPNLQYAHLTGADKVYPNLKRQIINPLKAAIEDNHVARLPKGLLLADPTGKNLPILARLIAGEAGKNLVTVDSKEFLNNSNAIDGEDITLAYQIAKKQRPCVLVLENFEALAESYARKTELGMTKETVIEQLLLDLNKVITNDEVFVVLSTKKDQEITHSLKDNNWRTMSAPDPIGLTPEGVQQVLIDALETAVNNDNVSVEKGMDIPALASQIPSDATAYEILLAVNEAYLFALENKQPIIGPKELAQAFSEMRSTQPSA